MDWQDYDWKDVTPIYEDKDKGNLAAIAYEPEYKEAMAYLRPIMTSGEHSERALALTKAIIADNPAHYSVWDYRYEIVKTLGNSLFDYTKVGLVKSQAPRVGEDGEWLNELTLDIPKNYQIWNYRQHLEMPGCAEFYKGEFVAVQFVLDDDAKNFHAWSHLKWAVAQSHKTGVPLKLELLRQFVDKLIEDDVYNNSAWSFRFFIYQVWPALKTEWPSEVDYIKQKIEVAPENEAVWTYAQGVFTEFGDLVELQKLALAYPNNPRALEVAAELGSDVVDQLCKLEEFRKPYYTYRFASR